MGTDTSILKRASQNYLLEFDLRDARHWALMGVDATGADTAPALADPGEPAALIAAFDGVSSVGTITGSIQNGGWSCDLRIPRFPASFNDYFGVDLMIRTWHADVPGVPGAAGVDTGRVRVFRGYQQTLQSERTYGKSASTFPIASSSEFLKRSSLRRGFDFAAAQPHGAPGSAHAVVEHLLLAHTNWYPRSNYGLYFPDHALDTFAVNEGSLWSMLTSLVGNFGIEPWIFCRREDDLFLGVHPNLDLDNLHPNKNDPIIELDDDLVLRWNIERRRADEVASVTIVAQRSDQTEYVGFAGSDSGAGSHVKHQIRSDDTATVDRLAGALLAHLNRRWTARPQLPLNVAIDLGDVITVTTRDPQRNIDWQGKKFVATQVSYTPVWDGRKRTFTSELVLDEVL